jgi:hypothetical protein
MHRILYLILLIAYTQKGFAQDSLVKIEPIAVVDTSLRVDSMKKTKVPEPVYPERTKAGYAELGGNGLGFSINYEHMILLKKKDYFVFKIGVGYYPYKNEQNYTIPITLGKLYRKHRYFLETGIGAVIYRSVKGRLNYNITGTLGYRKSFKQNKYFYKIAFTPYVTFNRDEKKKINFRDYDINPYVGFGIGKFF